MQLAAGPNPFSGRTELRYALPRAGSVKLEVFDLAGRPVATPVDGYQQAGRYSATFSARNMAPGVYVARLEANGQLITRKLDTHPVGRTQPVSPAGAQAPAGSLSDPFAMPAARKRPGHQSASENAALEAHPRATRTGPALRRPASVYGRRAPGSGADRR